MRSGYLPAFFCFFAALFSFRFFCAAFFATFPAPLSFEAMSSVYRAPRGFGQGADSVVRLTDTAMLDREPLPAQPVGMLGLMAGHEPSHGRDDSPPRQPLRSRQDVAHCPSGTGKACFFRHVTVCRDLALVQCADHVAYPLLELAARACLRDPTIHFSLTPHHRSRRGPLQGAPPEPR